MRRLIVNADDFGLCPGVNRGVVEAFDRGIVTSASLMVRGAAAPEAAALAGERPSLSLGLHLDLAEWAPSGEEGWVERYRRVDLDDPAAVREEVEDQLRAFERLTGRAPTHLDGHQHVQRDPRAGEPMRRLARRLDVPLRLDGGRVRWCGDFYGQDGRGRPFPGGVTVERLLGILRGLAAGWTELGCHPGLGVLPEESSYAGERGLETQALCDPRVAVAVRAAEVVLTSFTNLGGDRGAVRPGAGG